VIPDLAAVPTCSTPFGITEVGGLSLAFEGGSEQGAQRLSASQRWAGLTMCRKRRSTGCAQRLSASQRWADAGHDGATRLVGVLNAFRHHRGGRGAVGTYPFTLQKCSTPFGITEVGGPYRRVRENGLL